MIQLRIEKSTNQQAEANRHRISDPCEDKVKKDVSREIDQKAALSLYSFFFFLFAKKKNVARESKTKSVSSISSLSLSSVRVQVFSLAIDILSQRISRLGLHLFCENAAPGGREKNIHTMEAQRAYKNIPDRKR